MEPRPQDEHQGIVESLGMAVIGASTIPLVLLDARFRVLKASRRFGQTFGIAAEYLAGQPIFDLGDGEWDVPQLRSLLRATLSGAAEIEAYEMDLHTPARGLLRLVLNAQCVGDNAADEPRILLTIADVTQARAEQVRHAAALQEKDDLLRQRAVLLQEVRHRVANSLQIIASVLLQNARRVGSAESRDHLRDAHQRVMSVAALQHQLAASSLEGVSLRAYLTNLCESLGASMIDDPARISLVVDADATIVPSDESISLGLIVTELVINALKHAFPGKAKGRVTVSHRSRGDGWSLSISDDGIGMPTGGKPSQGLGTSIVEALSKQLGARVSVRDLQPGAGVSVTHVRSEGARAFMPTMN